MIGVHADADDHIPDQIDFGLDLGKDSAELLSASQKIIRPLDIDIHACVPLDRIVHRDSRGKREQRRETWRCLWKQHDREVKPGLAFRVPTPSKPATSSRL